MGSTIDPTRGTRRMTKELKKMGYQVGRTHVRTLMQIMRLKTVYCRPRTTVIDPAKYKFPYLLRNLPIVRPNHVWSLDITYVPMRRGFMYFLAIMDIYSRYIGKPPATDILGMNFSTANFALAEVCAVGWLDGQGLPKGF